MLERTAPHRHTATPQPRHAKAARKACPLEAWEGTVPANTLISDFKLPLWKHTLFVCFKPPVCGHSLQQPQETNTDNVSEWAAPGNVCSKELAESDGGLVWEPWELRQGGKKMEMGVKRRMWIRTSWCKQRSGKRELHSEVWAYLGSILHQGNVSRNYSITEQ